jgi:hypothetical protein
MALASVSRIAESIKSVASDDEGYVMCFRPAGADQSIDCPQCGKQINAIMGVFPPECPFCGLDTEKAQAMLAEQGGVMGVSAVAGMPGTPKAPGMPKAPKAPGVPKAPVAPK